MSSSSSSSSSQWSVSFWIFHHYPICIPLLHACAATCPTHLMIVIILGEEYKLRSSSLSSFLQPPLTSSPQSGFLHYRQRLSSAPIENHRQIYSLVYSTSYVRRQQTRRQTFLDWMVASITWFQSTLNILLIFSLFLTVFLWYLDWKFF
jgi:hypothetical protein